MISQTEAEAKGEEDPVQNIVNSVKDTSVNKLHALISKQKAGQQTPEDMQAMANLISQAESEARGEEDPMTKIMNDVMNKQKTGNGPSTGMQKLQAMLQRQQTGKQTPEDMQALAQLISQTEAEAKGEESPIAKVIQAVQKSQVNVPQKPSKDTMEQLRVVMQRVQQQRKKAVEKAMPSAGSTATAMKNMAAVLLHKQKSGKVTAEDVKQFRNMAALHKQASGVN